MAKAKSDKISTPQKRKKFLELLAEYGNVSKSADEAGLVRVSLYDHRKRSPQFADAWDEAEALGAKRLEDEARRRAMEGWEEPVYYQGSECGAVRRFSDTLLIVLLKAHFPDKYAERRKDEVSITDLAQRIEEGRKRAGKA